MSAIRVAKLPVLTEIAEGLHEISWATEGFDPVRPRVRRDADAVGAQFALPDDATALLFVATYKVGLPAGQFALAPSAHLRGGELWRRLRVDDVIASDSSWLVSLNTTLLPRTKDYVPATPRGVATTLRFLATVAPPILQSFLTDWPAALAFAEEHPRILGNPQAVLPAIRSASSA